MPQECLPSDRQAQATILLTALRGQPDYKELLQSAYKHFDRCVDSQLKYHVRDITESRRQRKRRPKERDYVSHIESEIQDDLTDRRQSLWAGMANAVSRLVKMSPERFAQIVDFDRYVEQEIRSQGSEAKLADDSHIRPPQSTNSTRRNRKDELGNPAPQEKYPALYRKNVDALPDEPADALSEIDCSPLAITNLRKGEDGQYYVPSSIAPFRGGYATEEIRDAIADGEIERSVLELLEDGCSYDEIAERTNLSHYAIGKIRKQLQNQARDLLGDRLPRDLRDAS